MYVHMIICMYVHHVDVAKQIPVCQTRPRSTNANQCLAPNPRVIKKPSAINKKRERQGGYLPFKPGMQKHHVELSFHAVSHEMTN